MTSTDSLPLPVRLNALFPRIPPASFAPGRCWIAMAKAQGEEHHPPFYWLGRALDAVDASPDAAAFVARLEAAHGAESCPGDERDERLQDVLSEACAFAWAAAHLGPPCFEPIEGTDGIADGPVRIHVEAHDAYVLPARLHRPPGADHDAQRRRAVRTLDESVPRESEAFVALATRVLPPARGRIVYVDTWIEELYAQNVGYRLELTEPVEDALRRAATAQHVGYVMTRPFQWGNPVVAWY